MSASAATPYDPDSFSLSTDSSADVHVMSGACTFDTNTGAISGGTGCPTRDNGTGVVDNGIGAVIVPSGDTNEPDTLEFVMNSLTVDSGASITFVGSRNLALATLHDLTVGSGALVNANGLGGPGGYAGGGQGPGGGDHGATCGASGGGGSFGGFGGDGGNGVPSGGLYGSSDQSQLLGQGSGGGGAALGAGCGTQAAGNGGGGVALIAMGTLAIDGTVSADGTPTTGPTSNLPNQGGPGGGSGGAILLMAPHLALANQFVAHAKGGYGYSTGMQFGDGGGGGGGGRIFMLSDQSSSALSTSSDVPGGMGGAAHNISGSGLGGKNGDAGSLDSGAFLTLAGPQTKQAGQAAAFTATQAFGHSALSWNFGDGTSGTGTNPSHTYTAPGTYTVTVTATLTDSGETAIAQGSITITPAPTPPGGPGGGGGTPTPTPVPLPAPAVQHCIVPKLKGLSLSAAKRKLAHAHCKLGKVKKPKFRKGTKKRKLVIVKQPKANKMLPAGTKINVTLAPAKPKHHRG
ncbi:MAG TPA: PKD domain-containing protein [Thermoleophilaceae bacterium]